MKVLAKPKISTLVCKRSTSLQTSFNSPKINSAAFKFRTQRLNVFTPIKTSNPVTSFDEQFDAFTSIAERMPLPDAIEHYFAQNIKYSQILFWENINHLQILYCPSKNIQCRRDEGLPGLAFVAKKSTFVYKPKNCPNFNSKVDAPLIDDTNSVCCFPLIDNMNEIHAIVEIISPLEFEEEFEIFVTNFQTKFRTAAKWLLADNLDEVVSQLLALSTLPHFHKVLSDRLVPLFHAYICEIWKFDKGKKLFLRDGVEVKEPEGMKAVLESGKGINSTMGMDFFMCELIKTPEYNFAVVLRKYVTLVDSNLNIPFEDKKHSAPFTPAEEKSLKRLTPFIYLGYQNAEVYTHCAEGIRDSQIEHDELTFLLEVAEILFSELDLQKLNELILDKAKKLTKAERCSLFLLTKGKTHLTSTVHSGLESEISFLASEGIAGKTVSTGKIFNIKDVYLDPDFNKSIDLETGYKTKSLISVPIYGHGGDIIGVTEMMNKIGEGYFTHWDQQLIQVFNIFVGISIENATLLRNSRKLNDQLHAILKTAFSFSNTDSMSFLQNLMKTSRDVVNAEAATLFLKDRAASALVPMIVEADKLPEIMQFEHEVATHCSTKKESLFINDCVNDPIASGIKKPSGFKTKSIAVAPAFGKNGEIIAVAEIINKRDGDFTEFDLRIVEAYSSLAAISIENHILQKIVEKGTAQLEIQQWISESEMQLTDKIPALLQLDEETKKICFSLQFFSCNYSGYDFFKIIFFFFHRFHLQERFKITNEMLFTFIYTISRCYHHTSYHNWIHACDVTQFVCYQINLAKLDELLSPLEMLAMVVGSICHDAGHDGFNNVFNVKAETPYGILYKEQSVMETHHCSVSIEILSKDECNLFHSLTSAETKKIWNLMIQLILATDMIKHFNLVKQGNSYEDSFNFEDPEMRLLSLKLILKCGDISNVSRPFEIADRWCDILNIEFFRQGDEEISQQIGLTSPLNDRNNSNKPKSQIGFYNFICIPLYSVVAKFFPPLKVNLDGVKDNLNKWKELAA